MKIILNRKLSFVLHSSERMKLIIKLHGKVTSIKFRKLLDILFIPLGMLNYILITLKPKQLQEFKYGLSIVVIVKNEALYLDEWIMYHKSVGVDHIFIYDNNSDDNLQSVVQKYGLYVTYTKINGQLRQLDAYNDALNKYSKVTKYLAVIDADEFLYCPKNGNKIYPVIDGFFKDPHVGGLAVNWVVFGSSDYQSKPNGLVTDNFVWRSKFDFEKNHLIKTICNPRKVFNFTISYAANYLPGYYAVNGNKDKIPWATSDVVATSDIRINHYYSKSKEEFIKKRARGSGEALGLRHLSEFDEHDRNDVFDDSLRVYNELQRKLNSSKG